MAGKNPNFNAKEFRDAIGFAMQMGLPEDPNERITFRWTPNKVYDDGDAGGNPWSWDSAPVSSDERPDVQVLAAVEFAARPAGSVDTPLGQFDTSRVTVTLLDEQFELIRGADLMVIDQNIYEVAFVGPPIGLFDVTVYQLYGEARDES